MTRPTLYNASGPVGKRWSSLLADSSIPRLYHSSLMLLRTGEVRWLVSRTCTGGRTAWSMVRMHGPQVMQRALLQQHFLQHTRSSLCDMRAPRSRPASEPRSKHNNKKLSRSALWQVLVAGSEVTLEYRIQASHAGAVAQTPCPSLQPSNHNAWTAARPAGSAAQAGTEQAIVMLLLIGKRPASGPAPLPGSHFHSLAPACSCCTWAAGAHTPNPSAAQPAGSSGCTWAAGVHAPIPSDGAAQALH